MTERLLLAAALLALFAAAVALGRAWLRRRDGRILARLRERHAATQETGEGTGAHEAGVRTASTPRIVYFTTETCVVCRAQQEPAIERLRAQVPDLHLDRYDAVREGALASDYGVLSVPTTAVYGRDGQLVAINRGFAPASVLYAQIEGREPALEGGAEMAGEVVGEAPVRGEGTGYPRSP